MRIVSTGVLGVAVGVIRWERESGGIGNVKNAIGSYGNEKPAGNSVDDTHTHVYTLQLREHSRNPARHLFQRLRACAGVFCRSGEFLLIFTVISG